MTRPLIPFALLVAVVAALATACGDEPASVGECKKNEDCSGGLICINNRCAMGDRDADGVLDDADLCPDVSDPDQADTDGDGIGDACDSDVDGDGKDNESDNCPLVPNPDQKDMDRDGKGDACDDDRDGDGVPDARDNCPEVRNANQANRDRDAQGDACDSDRDGDGKDNERDNCPDAPNPDQKDMDGDGKGDACDTSFDDDRDGVPNGNDNCPGDANADQKDSDGDGIGDACDPDNDGDGTDDADDNCPSVRNPDQKDTDGDGLGDACDPDLDGDGTPNARDNCPDLANESQADGDRDGVGDACDDEGGRTGLQYNAQCKKKLRQPFSTRKEWVWPGTQTLPAAVATKTGVMVTPVVGDLEKDGITDVVFTSFNLASNIFQPGALVAVDGRNGQTKWMVSPANNTLNGPGGIALANLDNSADGTLEIVAQRYQGSADPTKAAGLVVFSHTGAVLWSCTQTSNCVGYLTSSKNAWGAPSIADIDQAADGLPEIVYGATVYKRQPSGAYAILWDRSAAGTGIGNNGKSLGTVVDGQDQGVGPLSVVADLDMDGKPEVVTGRTAYRANGDTYWDDAAGEDGFVAIGNFDEDDHPEIVVVANAKIRLLQHDGQLAWGPFPLPFPAGEQVRRGGAPTVADFDGDGFAEVSVATNGMYAVFESDGQPLWAKNTQDRSSAATGSSVFDFEGDGWSEVVYNDEKYLRVYDGATGQVLFEEPNSTSTAYEYPVIADVDGDDHAEVIVGANPYGATPNTGLTCWGDDDVWVKTRRIWNQHAYSVTNIEADGKVPSRPMASWKPGTFETWPVGGAGGSFRSNASNPDGYWQPAADLQVSGIDIDRRACTASVTVRFWVDNRGAADVPAGVEVALYRGTAAVDGNLVAKKTTSRILKPGESERFSFTATGLNPGEQILIRVDGPASVSECSSKSNNSVTVSGVACPR